jgi:hypothetical protein
MAQQGIDKGTARISRGGVDNHTSRLVDDDEMCILKADIERDRLRLECRIFILRENYDKILVAFDAQCRIVNCRSRCRNVSALNQSFEPCSRQSREMRREHAVEPLSTVGFFDVDRRRDTSSRRISAHR